MALVLALALVQGTAKKRKKEGGEESIPDAELLARTAVPSSFGMEIANVSRAATKLRYWREYERTSKELVKTIMREAEKGTRILKFEVINLDRHFNQDGGMGPYNEVLDFMLKGKLNLKDQSGQEEAVINPMFACLPLHSVWRKSRRHHDLGAGSQWFGRYMGDVVDDLQRQENCHRWQTVSMLLPDGEGMETLNLPDISVDWRKVEELGTSCVMMALSGLRGLFLPETANYCQGSQRRRGDGGVAKNDMSLSSAMSQVECIELSDKQSENLLPQFQGSGQLDHRREHTHDDRVHENGREEVLADRKSMEPSACHPLRHPVRACEAILNAMLANATLTCWTQPVAMLANLLKDRWKLAHPSLGSRRQSLGSPHTGGPEGITCSSVRFLALSLSGVDAGQCLRNNFKNFNSGVEHANTIQRINKQRTKG
eukprot:767689-Hanusia_phi.AAC.5